MINNLGFGTYSHDSWNSIYKSKGTDFAQNRILKFIYFCKHFFISNF